VVFQPFEEIYEIKYSQDNSEKQTSKFIRWLILKLKAHVDKYCLTRVDIIGSEGEFQTEIFTKLFGVKRDKILELPVAVDIDTVSEILKQKKLSRQDLGINKEDFVLISVNRLEVTKGINYLVDAFKLVKGIIPNARLILVGSGSEEENIKSQIWAYNLGGSIIHMKNILDEKLYELYALSDLYISPSLDTGSIQSVIEAMACGLPIISTGQEFWVKEGVNGSLVPRGNSKALAEAILALYQSGRYKEFGEKSKEIAYCYDYKVIVRKIIKKYKELICQSKEK
ncbi:MAG: glycosyltransferase family 4 protein, partial [Candidatus Baldrarchaeia archaeon]